MNEYVPTHSSSLSGLAIFLQTLATSGDVAVSPVDPLDGGGTLDLDEEVERQLRLLDRIAREELAGPLADLDLAAAGWATRTLYRACQCLVCRDVSAEAVAAMISAPYHGTRTTAVVFSVDVIFRHLPELYGVAHRLAPGDALVSCLKQQARQWPLSSVGIEIDGEISLGVVADDPVLLRLYADRVTARAASDRLVDARLRAQLRADFGLYSSLSPFAVSALSS